MMAALESTKFIPFTFPLKVLFYNQSLLSVKTSRLIHLPDTSGGQKTRRPHCAQEPIVTTYEGLRSLCASAYILLRSALIRA
jgi:hypothetical protein